MKSICFLNVKGGVGKTTSTVNFAFVLAEMYDKRVLVVDMDKQGNTSMAFGVYSPNDKSIADLLLDANESAKEIIKPTLYKNIHVLPANMDLFNANRRILTETRVQQTRLRKHFEKDKIADIYDYCIFDCPTDLNISTCNALVCSDEVLVPIKIDAYSFVGFSDVVELIGEMKDFAPNLRISGCFATMYQNTNVNKQGIQTLQGHLSSYNINVFTTVIRHTAKVQESTFDKPLMVYAKNSTAAQDYIALVAEYIKG